MSESKQNMLIQAGWRYEGIGWYSDSAKKVPMYRPYNLNAIASNRNYTTDQEKNDHKVSLG